jgi:hypothetical protein
MKKIIAVLLLLFVSPHFLTVCAQQNRQSQKQEQCATMPRLEAKFKRNPAFKEKFDRQLETFNKEMARRQRGVDTRLNGKEAATYTIPVVFHIVLSNQSTVTDAQILAQLDILNKTYAGTNPDTVQIPGYFKPLFGSSTIQFCLAQQTPDGEPTDGIERTVTTTSSFSPGNDFVKHAVTGGADIWDGDRYFNVWVCVLSGNILGYATFPDDGVPDEQGVVLDFQTLPGGPLNNYNGGKTLTHETGHYFNLFHIWGDDDGACTGTDFIEDTPNQAGPSSGCRTGIVTDNCTPNGDGIMYQNFMDYSYDQCLLLFTTEQVDRMETALLTFRPSLTVSNACAPPVLVPLDAQLKSIIAPEQRICKDNFTPVVTVRNLGMQTLTSLVISAVIDNGTPVNYNWAGTLTSLATTTITLNSTTVIEGNHNLKIFVSSPNGGVDGKSSNDTLSAPVQYFAPVAKVTEGFEGTTFPPLGWDILNPDNLITWQRYTGIAKTGNASVGINNFNYALNDQKDYLRLPEVNFVNIDSAFFYFQVAANTYTPYNTENNTWDTLEVLVSQDCGLTYNSLYKKWGASLVTASQETTDEFIPKANEWRRDSLNLTPYINQGQIMLAFRNTTEFENNIYLDDINIRTVTINPNLKAKGYLITPNPAKNRISVQFYPNPTDLKGLEIYNTLGQKLDAITVASGGGAVAYNFDISRYAFGTYYVRVVFANRVIVDKIIKAQ